MGVEAIVGETTELVEGDADARVDALIRWMVAVGHRTHPHLFDRSLCMVADGDRAAELSSYGVVQEEETA